MHDIHKDSIVSKSKGKKGTKQKQLYSHGDEHRHPHQNDHNHDHGETGQRGHDHAVHSHDHPHTNDHSTSHGHDHNHDDSAYEEHDHDIHTHHDHEEYEDRAINHMHDHGHNFYHTHHHTHHPEHIGLVHKIFKDPVRDWFGAALMGFLILAGYFKWLPGNLSDGMLICAAVIGIFPVIKNALFDCIAKRILSLKLLVGVLLLVGLFTGRFLEIALISLFLLVGSFMRLNFSWRG